MKKKLNIAILSDSPFLCTGYSDQAKYIGNLFVKEGHSVDYFAHTYTGQNVMPPITFEDGRQLNFKVIGQGREQYFKDILSIYLKQYKIDVLVILLDTFMTYPWLLSIDFSPAKTIFWFPSDGGGGLPLNCEQILKKIDVPIAMAKYGQEQCKKLYGLNVHHIPHFVDTDNYYPLPPEKKLELRKKWKLEDKFVIGVVARNQGRKMLDRTVKAMAVYAKKNPHAVLLMHLDPDDPAQVFPITALIKRYGIENRCIFTGTKYYKGFNFKDMNEVYNIMDVFLLTTSGEGFGIPLIEAQACEVPVIATDYTTTRELVLDAEAGLGIKLAGTEDDENPNVHTTEILDGTLTGSWAVERGICSIKDCVNKLDYMYNNLDKRKEFAKNGRLNVLEHYNLHKTGQMWLDIVEKLGNLY